MERYLYASGSKQTGKWCYENLIILEGDLGSIKTPVSGEDRIYGE